MRLLCLPYFQETGGTHRFSGRGFFLNGAWLRLPHHHYHHGTDSSNAPQISIVTELQRFYFLPVQVQHSQKPDKRLRHSFSL